ncbi:nucleoid occlusion protein [Macrococcoides bohemicum]|uniref:Nucleoid occlusion protein n=1 Tax=Macrococcoides bohemicum TaxID=1903056 RepID=A0A4R5Y525_9STAP|nr:MULTISPECIES: nucleoid occlusion protein [Macrococcus]ATD31631.1 nucleoid occlusion protein [Macrococcus sp. IME1552]QRN50929.1 nucleoid occlusion protein [Macrococcus bohemicus]QYA42373.1 nucleoid occlusion protein [Macrococcus bohemicus]QYA44763.1 nucleoid occlusion protein [Macrococcus bohemicus]TDL38222.1 nucleoid occlusion protein [Macrococcus bohemicus]
MKKPFSKLFGLKDKEEDVDVQRQNGNVVTVPVERIVPNRYQPRQIFDEEKIKELAESIRSYGLLQPIVVRPIEEGMYEIIAGERRFRALKFNSTAETEVIVKQMNDKETAAIALIENIQRENLSAVEEAEAYKKLLDLDGITQQDLATSLGKSQSFIANKLRLLRLSQPILDALGKQQITERHARALLALDEVGQKKMLDIIKSQNLNVKQTEERVKRLLGGEDVKPKRIGFTRDLKLAFNTIGESLKAVEKSGVKVKRKDTEYENFYEISIKVFKNDMNQ